LLTTAPPLHLSTIAAAPLRVQRTVPLPACTFEHPRPLLFGHLEHRRRCRQSRVVDLTSSAEPLQRARLSAPALLLARDIAGRPHRRAVNGGNLVMSRGEPGGMRCPLTRGSRPRPGSDAPPLPDPVPAAAVASTTLPASRSCPGGGTAGGDGSARSLTSCRLSWQPERAARRLPIRISSYHPQIVSPGLNSSSRGPGRQPAQRATSGQGFSLSRP